MINVAGGLKPDTAARNRSNWLNAHEVVCSARRHHIAAS